MTKDNQDITFRKLIDKHFKDDPHLFIPQTFDNTCRNKSLSNDKLKVLKDELGKDIVVQVEEADRRKPILLVGSNDALVKGTLALIWNTHPLIYDNKPKMGQSLLGYNNKDVERIFFLDKNCSGLSEEEIKRELFHKSELSDEEREEHFLNHECIELIKPLINVYKRGYVMLSLRGLEDKQHKNILKRLGVIKEGYRRDLINGVLIVGIDSTDTLPQEFKDQFEIIELEPKKQDIPASTPQKVISFPISSGASINDIKMFFLNDENVCITIKGESRYFHYAQMGFSHKKAGSPLGMWETLLEYAEYNRALRNVTHKKQKDSERINKKLKIFFETNENLIIRNQAVFSISKKINQSKKPPNIQSKECPKCKETHKHYCFVCNDETEDCKDCHNELYKKIHNEPSGRIRNLSR